MGRHMANMWRDSALIKNNEENKGELGDLRDRNGEGKAPAHQLGLEPWEVETIYSLVTWRPSQLSVRIPWGVGWEVPPSWGQYLRRETASSVGRRAQMAGAWEGVWTAARLTGDQPGHFPYGSRARGCLSSSEGA